MARNGQFTSTGFSENDEVLGGPIYPNNDVVFTAKQRESHYWKVETKDYYSGKGWQSTIDDRQSISRTPLELTEEPQTYNNQSETIELTFTRHLTYLPKPAGKINWPLADDWTVSGDINYSAANNRIYLPRKLDIKEVEYDYYPPVYSVDQLTSASAVYDLATENPYLQLPDDLPQRVTALAREKTMNAESDYAKVKAIETYLKNDSGFTYSMAKAQKVPQASDYVDHFLFESFVGYCEHYSSAMVVMLRSIGIPSRWVKGFSGGVPSEKLKDGRTLFTITNGNAHAWAEVYFRDIGWVPFEPTKSFISQEQVSLLAQGIRQSEPERLPTDTNTTPVETANTTSQNPEEKANELAEKSGATGIPTDRQQNSKSLTVWQLGLTGGGLTLVGVSLFLVRTRLSWLVIMIKLKVLPTYSFTKVFKATLGLAEKKASRSTFETLREYYHKLRLLDTPIPRSFLTLIDTYESQQYGQNKDRKPSAKELTQFQELYRWIVAPKKTIT